MKNSNNDSRVWLVTGTSKGFGHELVRSALQRGDCVIATSRTPEKVMADFPDFSDNLFAINLDLRSPEQIKKSIQTAVEHFGHIDYLINNAGHGLLGAVEEANDAEILNVYETNVFGLIRITRALLPYLRKQGSGHIVNISSIGGLVGLAGWGIYNSTKFAIEGLSEALAIELAPLGIKVTIVEPGPFRTDFLGSALTTATEVIEDYKDTAGKTRQSSKERKGMQPGDPAAAADAIIEAVTSENPPLHLLLGEMAFEKANKKLDDLRNEFSSWKELTLSSDYR